MTANADRFLPAHTAIDRHDSAVLFKHAAIESAAVKTRNEDGTDERDANSATVNVPAKHQPDAVRMPPIEVVRRVTETQTEGSRWGATQVRRGAKPRPLVPNCDARHAANRDFLPVITKDRVAGVGKF